MKKIHNSDYCVTEHGDVINSRTGKILQQQNNNGGKHSVLITIDGKRCKRYVHRLVAEVYVDNKDNKPCVDHIDGDNSNNCASNLRWCTDEENQMFRVKQGIDGSDSVRQKISYDGVIYNSIRELSRILANSRGCKAETVRKSIKAARHGTIMLYGKECMYV